MKREESKKILALPIKKAVRERYGNKTAAVLHLMLEEQRSAHREDRLAKIENKYWFRMKQAEMKYALGVVESTIYVCFKQLEDQGVIRSRRCPDDKRRKLFWVFEEKI